MNKRHVYWLGTLAVAMALFAAPRGSSADEFVFGDFEADVQSGGQYILDQNEAGYAGWFDWEFPEGTPRPTYSPVTPNSNAAFVTSGTYSMPWQPAQTGTVMVGEQEFPYAGGLDQGLAVKMQDLPAATKVGLFDGFFNNNHIALDAIWDSDEWSANYLGDGWNGANVRLRMNYGGGANPGTSVILGVESPFNPGEFGYPDVDTENAGAPGHWDIGFATPSRTMAWNYSAHKQAIQDLFTAGDLNETNGWLEFVLETSVGNFVHPVTYYTDNWRFASYSTGTPDTVVNYQLPDAASWPGSPVHTTTGNLIVGGPASQFNLEAEIRPPGLIAPGDPSGGVTHTFIPDSTFVLDGFAIRAAGAPTTGLLYLYTDPNLVGGTEADGFVNAGPDGARFAQTLIDGLPYTFFGTADRTFLVFDLQGVDGEIVLQAGVQYAIDLRNTGVEGEPAADHVMYWMRASDGADQNNYTGGNIYARNPVEVGDESERFDVAGGGRRDGTLALYAVLPPAMVGLPGDYNGDGFVDAADYTVWRNNLGGDESAFAAGTRDPGNMGLIDEDDYTFWKNNYGNGNAGAGGLAGLAGSVVPEPSTIAILLGGLCLVQLRRRIR